MARSITAEMSGRLRLGGAKLPAPMRCNRFISESYWSAAGSFGMKGNVASRMLVTFNLRFAVTEGGLTDRLSPLLGVEWSF